VSKGERKRSSTTPVSQASRLLSLSAANVRVLADYRLYLEARAVRPASQFKIFELAVRFAQHCEPRPLLKATTADVEAFLETANIGASSRYHYISTLHCLYHWAENYGHSKHDPTKRVPRPRMPRGIPHPIDDDDLKRALAGARKTQRAMMALAAFHGLRAGEIARLQRGDIIDQNTPPVLIVQEGKGGHSRVLPLKVEAWKEYIRPITHGVNSWLFTWPNGEPYKPVRVAYMIRRELHAMDIDASAHSLRHWYGTKVYGASHDLRVTQALMGHASPATTVGYVAFSARDAHEAVALIGLS
jgi:site-specific recombinase XerD